MGPVFLFHRQLLSVLVMAKLLCKYQLLDLKSESRDTEGADLDLVQINVSVFSQPLFSIIFYADFLSFVGPSVQFRDAQCC